MKKKKISMAVLIAILLCIVQPVTVKAAEAEAHFGSNYYAKAEGESFNIGLYLEAEEGFLDYSLTMTYDPNIIEYVSGAVSGGDGSVTISGAAENGYVKVLVRFQAVAVGDTTLTISDVYAHDGAGEAFTINNQGSVSLSVRADNPVYLSGILIDGQEMDVFEETVFEYELSVPYETDWINVEAVGHEAEISDTELKVGENIISLRLSSPGGIQTVYNLHVTRQEEGILPPEQETVPEESAAGQNNTEQNNGEQSQGEIEIPYMEYEDGDFSVSGLLAGILTQKVVLIPIILVCILVLGVSSLATYLEYIREKEREDRRARAAEKKTDWTIQIDDLDEEDIDGNEVQGEDTQEKDTEEVWLEYAYDDPVIFVDDVCMDFKVATQNVSGVKEWLIEKVKGKISYRILHALDHISFEVYPGEVVGIIGTNGSGKSTLLKIVSGVLSPTSGHVEADRSKIQLLTLGTGFDMELTARENVYLNGAIIGYDREFIDEHYDAIVEFAELDGFMEEKVKNFSSGMVSRLGFAIATAGDAAEILILDEVLSVGDEFFRKKSLARVKEMIHGGSTVLMVSHGMETIRENCSKVIWVEKGKLRMIGDADTVCKAYQKMEQNWDGVK